MQRRHCVDYIASSDWMFDSILWRMDPLLGRDLETNNETKAVAMQQSGKHPSTIIDLLLETVLCNPC
jgi:hypothetical protein